MKRLHTLFLSLAALGLAATLAPDADACGGCVPPEGEDTQVTGHRMIFSVSATQTTLYDQIEYSGSPSSFAWFLPIKGQVDIDLSADAMFAYLGQDSIPYVAPPPLNCPPPPDGCYTDEDFGANADGGTGGGGGGSPGGGVEIITQEVVGPFETVQLSASNPSALFMWFADHGFSVSNDVKAVMTDYLNEGFDFLAMKLVPGQGVQAMKPVRITTQGGGLTMPLRMVAAGTGALTPITLFVVGEGRYEAASHPNILVDPTQLVWHWNSSTSNYPELIKGMFEAGDGYPWLTQSAAQYYPDDLRGRVQQLLDFNPGQTDWGDPTTGVTEQEAATADLDALFGGMDPSSVWLTRLHAQLTRPALGTDLQIGAEMTQQAVNRYLQSTAYDGTPPTCPDYSWCDPGAQGGDGYDSIGGDKADDTYFKGSSSGCTVQPAGDTNNGVAFGFVGIGLAAAVTAIRRRRK